MVARRRHIPTGYSAGPKADGPWEPWVARLRLRASTIILWRRSEFYPANGSCRNLILISFKERVLKLFTRWAPLDKFILAHNKRRRAFLPALNGGVSSAKI
ncbi:hypothetical protein Nhal_2139 [Nitrosococcus halophilus Nc 4]|uniref:Uncharacterized protein n=1 Tax=Nitrosococcus halophilus (strain Nc4) TaxID=472759 RepID=D5C515_NITHN|nr:hypothetical protein Nhal_2139 [Nitrosococcus halophilus Nc 4]